MIDNKRIVDEINCAIDYLSKIKLCYERDGFVAESYVNEKATRARRCVDSVLNMAEEDEND